MQEFVRSLINESDRGCVLVAAAKIEIALESIFSKIFGLNAIPNKIAARMFDVGGPLSTFSSKNKLAYAMGLIAKDAYTDIEIVRNLRNTFAHSIEVAEFLDPGVADIVFSLKCVKSLNMPPPGGTGKEKLSAQQQAKIFADGFVTVTKTAFSVGIYYLLQNLDGPVPSPHFPAPT